MRLFVSLVLLAVAAGVAVVAVTGEEDDGAADDTGALTMVGDSLNVGTDPPLREQLPRWDVDAHDRAGRTTAEGIGVLRERAGSLAPVVVVSLGTNDSDGTEDEFRGLVEEAVEIVGPDRCLVWATVHRGEARTGFNDVLREAAAAHDNVRLVDWAFLVAECPELLAFDGVHGTPDGYARRAAETVEAVRTCPDRGAA
jgi:lysophospholipase L1-like esterase